MLDRRQANAIRKAVERGGAKLVRRVRFGLYLIESAHEAGRVYTVRVDAQGRYSCDCAAGASGRPCWHAAAVYVAKIEHSSGGRVTAPAS